MNLAVTLAKGEGIVDIEVVTLAALLHDIGDWKYSGNGDAGVEAVEQWLVVRFAVLPTNIDFLTLRCY